MESRPTPRPDAEPAASEPAPVCTLPADGLAERLAWIRREILPHAIRTVRLDDGLAFELAPAAGLAETLDRLIALERECCRGLALERRAGATPGGLRLEVRGLDPDASILRSLGSASGKRGPG